MRAVFLTFFIFFFTVASQAQGFKIPDSLKGKSYEEIYKGYRKAYNDTTKSLVYMHSYLQKAKQEGNKIHMAKGYAFVADYQIDGNVKLLYLDSSIVSSKNLNNPTYPALPFVAKGGHYEAKYNYEKALDNYILSLKAAEKNGSNYYIGTARSNIGILKNILGRYDEAIKTNIEHLNYLEKNLRFLGDSLHYLENLVRLSLIYSKMKNIDSSSVYIEKGKSFSKLTRFDPLVPDGFLHYFVFIDGMNHFHQGKYKEAIHIINKSLPFSKCTWYDFSGSGYIYLGKVYQELGKKDSARLYYQKTDSVYQSTGYLGMELREAYNGLVNYYKEKNDLKNQLVYVEKLLKFDSIYQDNYKLMDKKLLNEYDIPNALAQKEEIIAALEAEKSTNTTQIAIILLLLALSLGGVGYYYRNQRAYKKRFLQLVADKNTPAIPVEEEIQKDKTTATISDEARDHLLQQLQQFEDKHGYLKPKINSKDLAKRFGSNSSYLSIVVNTYKQKSFSQYINDLRIEYAVKRLQTDTKFRKYTIKAIAQEIGFNTAEAFAKTFYKNTGIYPSYFIKQLEK